GSGARFVPSADNRSGVLTWTPRVLDAGGPYAVSFTARNALQGTAASAITVIRLEHPPVVQAPAALSCAEGHAIRFTVTASDPDADPITSLTADLSQLPAGSTASFTPGPDNA